ncbi:hypothetical protein GDO78_004654 [Eleutherodactylus coqui]|uniref:Uncharacterized protein n=1 Tax=Eleutherodactylus coqui TaxID=57060 RepID=A0A8J6ETD0_ELECQ|nr:hypothetical protein GDO78_004654 [Eleutherodactylus coqui]
MWKSPPCGRPSSPLVTGFKTFLCLLYVRNSNFHSMTRKCRGTSINLWWENGRILFQRRLHFFHDGLPLLCCPYITYVLGHRT